MKIVIIITCFLTGYLLALSVHRLLRYKKSDVLDRLENINKKERYRHTAFEELNLPLFERVLKPLLGSASKRFCKILPAAKHESLQKKLTLAGNPGNLTPQEFTVLRYALIFGLPLLSGMISINFYPSINHNLLIVASTFGVSTILPNTFLNLRIARRKEEVNDTLPEVLDLLTVSVEAGLGFDSALSKVIEKFKGVLSEEFLRVLQEIKKGKPRKEALKDLANRCEVEDLSGFISSIIQADQLGVSIGNVLRIQSKQMRRKKRQRAEEQAMKAPIKMLFPLVFFIFPTIFVILLGPAVIQILETFSTL